MNARKAKRFSSEHTYRRSPAQQRRLGGGEPGCEPVMGSRDRRVDIARVVVVQRDRLAGEVELEVCLQKMLRVQAPDLASQQPIACT